jgi:uncharacterized membrane protein
MADHLMEQLRERGRILIAAVAGVAADFVAQKSGLPPGAAALVGWNGAALLFLGPTLAILLSADPEGLRRRASLRDERRTVMMGLILGAVAVSFGAIVVALRESRASAQHGGLHHPAAILALCVSTLVLSWAVVQSLFTLHYAHLYFGDRDGDKAPDEGIKFPGAPPTLYRDFLYVAVCIGATCQVSDFNITHRRFRDLVTVHALISFIFNTLVLALGVNIVGNLMGQ